MTMRHIKGWKATCRRILARDGYMCMMPRCIAPSRAGATTVDHIVPRVHGGGHEDSNLRAAHRVCNSSAGAHRKVMLPMSAPSRW